MNLARSTSDMDSRLSHYRYTPPKVQGLSLSASTSPRKTISTPIAKRVEKVFPSQMPQDVERTCLTMALEARSSCSGSNRSSIVSHSPAELSMCRPLTAGTAAGQEAACGIRHRRASMPGRIGGTMQLDLISVQPRSPGSRSPVRCSPTPVCVPLLDDESWAVEAPHSPLEAGQRCNTSPTVPGRGLLVGELNACAASGPSSPLSPQRQRCTVPPAVCAPPASASIIPAAAVQAHPTSPCAQAKSAPTLDVLAASFDPFSDARSIVTEAAAAAADAAAAATRAEDAARRAGQAAALCERAVKAAESAREDAKAAAARAAELAAQAQAAIEFLEAGGRGSGSGGRGAGAKGGGSVHPSTCSVEEGSAEALLAAAVEEEDRPPNKRMSFRQRRGSKFLDALCAPPNDEALAASAQKGTSQEIISMPSLSSPHPQAAESALNDAHGLFGQSQLNAPPRRGVEQGSAAWEKRAGEQAVEARALEAKVGSGSAEPGVRAAAGAWAAVQGRDGCKHQDEVPTGSPARTFRQRRRSKYIDPNDCPVDAMNGASVHPQATPGSPHVSPPSAAADAADRSSSAGSGPCPRGPPSGPKKVPSIDGTGASAALPDNPPCEVFHDLRSSVEAPTQVRQALELGEEDGVAELALDPELVCSFSCHGIEPARDGTGQHKVNQDAACVCYPFCQDPQCALFCVLDGHGRHGASVSAVAMDHLVEEIERRLVDDEAIVDAFKHAFEGTNTFLASSPAVDATQSGACALALLLHGNRLWVAGAGDCRAVLGAVDDKTGQLYAIRLSLDHKPTDPQELARITAAGACVWEGVKDHEEGYEPPRVYRDLHNRRLGPGLAMSRCLGDLDDTDAGISPTPTVRYWDLCSDGSRNGRRDLFILMASDGVWEHLSDEEAVALIGRFHAAGQSARVACTNLMAHAALRWRREEGNYRDDITAICAYLPCVNERSERATLDAAALGAAQTEPGTRRA